MVEKAVLSLRGRGYLHDVYSSGHNKRITLIVNHRHDEHFTEELWIDCRVEESKFLPLINALASYIALKMEVVLDFEAVYRCFECCHSGLTEDDRDIVRIDGKLLNIHDVSVDGAPIWPSLQRWIEQKPVLHKERD